MRKKVVGVNYGKGKHLVENVVNVGKTEENWRN